MHRTRSTRIYYSISGIREQHQKQQQKQELTHQARQTGIIATNRRGPNAQIAQQARVWSECYEYCYKVLFGLL